MLHQRFPLHVPRRDGIVLGGTFEHERESLDADANQTTLTLDGNAIMKRAPTLTSSAGLIVYYRGQKRESSNANPVVSWRPLVTDWQRFPERFTWNAGPQPGLARI